MVPLVHVIRVLPTTLLIAARLPAQSTTPDPRPPRVAVFDVALFTAGANQQQASDTGRAVLATQVLGSTLRELLGAAIIDSAATDSLARAPGNHPLTGDQPCIVVVACTKAVGKALGAEWVVMAKVSKTSNLIWLLSSQLIHVPTGEIVLDDSTELKGDPGPMIRAGVRIFAERVARTIRERAAGQRTQRP